MFQEIIFFLTNNSIHLLYKKGKTIMNRNEKLRLEFKQFLVTYFNPRVSLIAQHIDVNYTYLSDWKQGRKDAGDDLLNKVALFLKEYRK